MSDEPKAEPTEAAEVEQNAVEESAAQEPAEEQPQEEPKQHMIPKSRFDEVIAERNELRKKMEALSQPKDEPETQEQTESVEIPAHITDPMRRAQYLVDKFSKQTIERELGMPLADVKRLLGTTQETSRDYAKRRWVDECGKHGLDPQNREVEEYVVGLVKGVGKPLDEAMAAAKKLFGKRNGETKTASVETDSVAPVMTRATTVPRNKKDAVAMAHKGERAPKTTIEEILASRGQGK